MDLPPLSCSVSSLYPPLDPLSHALSAGPSLFFVAFSSPCSLFRAVSTCLPPGSHRPFRGYLPLQQSIGLLTPSNPSLGSLNFGFWSLDFTVTRPSSAVHDSEHTNLSPFDDVS